MIDINKFLNQHQIEIGNIISDLDVNFSSHDFIKKFAQQFEEEYIEMLVNYQNNGQAFQTIHSMISKYLSLNKNSFSIIKTGKGPSENVFGSIDDIEWWKRI